MDHCLSVAFPKNGMVLQDLVNELGRRLDYVATNGRYQGVQGKIGFDGLWLSPEGHTLVVEVKTTDAYRLSLDTLATYRARLDFSRIDSRALDQTTDRLRGQIVGPYPRQRAFAGQMER